MNAIDSIREFAKSYEVPIARIVVSYGPKEGLWAWFMRTETNSTGCKPTDFLKEAMVFINNGWWWKEDYSEMDGQSSFIADDGDIDMGPSPFTMSFEQFKSHYAVLDRATYGADEKSVNVVGVDYKAISSGSKHLGLENFGFVVKADSFKVNGRQVAPKPSKYPIIYNVCGQYFGNIEDANKHIRYRELVDLIFDEFPHIDADTRRCLVSEMIKNQTEIINHLKGL